MHEADPLTMVSESLDRLAGSIDSALAQVAANATDLGDTRAELGRWQRAIVILALLVIGGWATMLGVFTYSRQVDCDRTNDARRLLNERPGIDIPLRDCAWPS